MKEVKRYHHHLCLIDQEYQERNINMRDRDWVSNLLDVYILEISGAYCRQTKVINDSRVIYAPQL